MLSIKLSDSIVGLKSRILQKQLRNDNESYFDNNLLVFQLSTDSECSATDCPDTASFHLQTVYQYAVAYPITYSAIYAVAYVIACAAADGQPVVAFSYGVLLRFFVAFLVALFVA